MGYLDNTGLAYFWDKIKAALNLKQDTLVSGTNIKTINNESLLGSGNINIQGGAAACNVEVVEYGNSTYSDVTAALATGKPLFCYVSWNSIVCPYIGVVNNQYAFSNLGAGESTVSLYVNSSNQWSYATSNLATRSEVNAKQDALVSGTNIKTINNESLLGSGNISISGGSSILFVTVTYANNTYTADKTYAEMYAAITAGQTVIVKLVDHDTNTFLYLYSYPEYSGDDLWFTGFETGLGPNIAESMRVTYSDYWTHDTNALAKLSSPAFTGNPTAPTQTAGNNSTRIATTAFVQNELDGVWTLSGGTAIPSDADLNDYTTQGNYYSSLNSTARTVLNTPWGAAASSNAMAFILKVIKPTTGSGTNMYVRQELYPYKSTAKYVRYTAVDSPTTVSWQPWVQILTTDDQASRAQYLSNYYHDGTGGTRPTTANIPSDNRAGLRKFIATGSMTEGKPSSDGHIIHMDWDNSARWAAQIWVNNSGTMMGIRGQTGASTATNGGWSDWTYMATRTWVTTQIADAIGSALTASY